MPDYSGWVAELMERRRVIDSTVKPLLQGAEQIDAALAVIQPLASGEPPAAPPADEPTGGPHDLPVWKYARRALAQLDRPASVAEIASIIEPQVGRSYAGRARENLRGILISKKEEFEPLGGGVYALREWPDNKKGPLFGGSS